ncbi:MULTISPECIES: hypothetical protein [unclassified Pseudomonas]|uniref:hypothetical protein n=1 Tax=unclassified Pseudomonas TaxID=196821 RepID=UPI001A9D838A|nr:MULTISPECIES: hypothetical protein [unclassified Pseudomonas]
MALSSEQAESFKGGKYRTWGSQDPNYVDRSRATKTWDPSVWKNPFDVKMPWHPEGCQCPECRSNGSKGQVASGLPYFPDLMVMAHDPVKAASKEEVAACLKELVKKSIIRNPMTGDYHSVEMEITYGGSKCRYLVLHKGGIDAPSSDVGELIDAPMPDGVDVVEKVVLFTEANGDFMRRNIQRWKCNK